MALHAHVDPFIGVDGGGNTLCGPYLPYSLIRLGPDTGGPHDRPTSGYRSDEPIRCFSHTHVSGTGGGGRYGNVGMAPYCGAIGDRPRAFQKEAEKASAGYYAVTLQPGGMRADLTSTPRVGVHRYTFPAGATANVFIDAAAVIQVRGMMPGSRGPEGTGACTGGYIERASEYEIVGRGDFRGGWGHNFPYSVYFAAQFDRPMSDCRVGNRSGVIPGTCADESGCFANAQFGKIGELNVRVGISYVSVANARASIQRETAGKTFDTLRAEAETVWEETLRKIRVEGGTRDQLALFYTQFTRLVCMPSDLGVDDEFPLWKSGRRHFTDFYTLWDSVRNANALIMLFAPEETVDQLNCLLDIADHTGWLPDVWIQGHHGMVQGGSSADVLFCEAAAKGLAGIDYERALRHMRRNGEEESPNPHLFGRHLRDYRNVGHVSTETPRNCVSRHLEYAFQDWCISDLAQRLGHDTVAVPFREGAGKVWNLWRDDLKCFAPRTRAGAWVNPFDQDCCRADSWNDPFFYEGTSRQWSFSVQHDIAGLITRHGGADAFVRHLDVFFEGGHFHPKETMLHIPWLYTYAGRPDLAADRVRQCRERYFRPARNGLSDNEDMGCQSAFYMCSAMGLCPVMGQALYLLTPPVFSRAEITLGQSGHTLTIEAPGAGPGGRFVAGAVLNGVPLDRAWLRHDEVAAGATLRLELDAQPSDWGRSLPPPSPFAPAS